VDKIVSRRVRLAGIATTRRGRRLAMTVRTEIIHKAVRFGIQSNNGTNEDKKTKGGGRRMRAAIIKEDMQVSKRTGRRLPRRR